MRRLWENKANATHLDATIKRKETGRKLMLTTMLEGIVKGQSGSRKKSLKLMEDVKRAEYKKPSTKHTPWDDVDKIRNNKKLCVVTVDYVCFGNNLL